MKRNKWLYAALLLWAALIALCLRFRETLFDDILRYTPRNSWLAAGVIVALFAVKSVSVVLYSGVLYAASGVLFPLPTALAVSLAGTAVMFLIPYQVGRRSGGESVEQLMEKYPRLHALRDLREKNDFLFTLAVRSMRLLSYDVTSLYLGAAGAAFPAYMGASLLASLPSLVAFTAMGTGAGDLSSPTFWIALGMEAGMLAFSLLCGRKTARCGE